MPTYEGVRLRILGIKRKKFARLRVRKLKNKNFTIISNNCWAGMIYESYGLIKQTPTVGLYFFSNDYIKFITSLKSYLRKELIFIKPEQSKWYDKIKNDKKIGKYPIARLGDVEVFFLHYKSEEEAIEKWNRRIKRINWNNILYKFNDQNGCTVNDYINFMNLPYKNKLFFTVKDWPRVNGEKNYIKIHQLSKKNYILASYEPFGKTRKIDITKVLNSMNENKDN